MKNNKMKIIVIFVVLIIYGAFVVILSYQNKDNNNSNNNNVNNEIPTEVENNNYDILIVNNYSIWKFNNNEWKSINKLNNYNNKLNTYIDGNYFGKYYLKFINSWNIIDENNNVINYNGKIFAHSNNLKIDIINSNVDVTTEIELLEIQEIVGTYINANSLSVNERIVTDLDNDGLNDKIINVSNLDASDVQEKYFNLCYTELNGNRIILFYNIVEEKNLLIEPVYNIQYVININDNTYNNIILQRSYFSNNGETANEMYEYRDSKYLIAVKD